MTAYIATCMYILKQNRATKTYMYLYYVTCKRQMEGSVLRVRPPSKY